MNETDVMRGLFGAAWRRGREQLRQQSPTISALFEAAKSANGALPGAPPSIENVTEETHQELVKWWEEHLTAIGARDAYASAVVLFIDNVLKGILRFYDMIPGVTRDFDSGLNGVSTPEIFRNSGNNVRHYEDWLHLMGRPREHWEERLVDQGHATVVALAKVLHRPIPDRSGFTVMAANHAWIVLAVVSGREFDGLIHFVRDFMDELLIKTGLFDDPLVLAEVSKEK